MIAKVIQFIHKLKPHTPNIFWSNFNQMVITITALLVSIVFANLASKRNYEQYIIIQGGVKY